MLLRKYKKMLSAVMCAMLAAGGINTAPYATQYTVVQAAEAVNLLDNASFSANTDGWFATCADGAAKLEFVNDGKGHDSDGGYVKVTGRSDTWNSLAQTIKDKVVSGTKYDFSCWVKLGEEYTEQSTVKVGLTIQSDGDNGGEPIYDGWGISENTVTASKNEWRQIKGSFTAKWSGKLTDLQFKVADETCKNSFYVDALSLAASTADLSIEEDLTPLKDYFASKSAKYDFKVGCAMTHAELDNPNKMKLVAKHYNSVTAGNEMKPDYIIKGINADNSLQLDFTIPDKTLQTFWDYNQGKDKKDQIQMRGHVLCWHSQTPEIFFKDKDGKLLSKDAMNKRLEEYIKAVLEHVQAKYPGLVYGWDVVNEAIVPSDGEAGGLRVKNGNAETYYHQIYGSSNEYIVNAFTYANKYADPAVKLFYNDYGETDPTKVSCICSLADAIKAAAGARIDGIGMQAHYSMESPSVDEFYSAVTAYAKHVSEVQITELDVLASKSYDGSADQKDTEQTKLAYRYKEIFDAILKAKDEGVNISAVVLWGVCDDDSWLLSPQFSQGRHNMPLLFDENMKAKPAYWGIVDSGKLLPNINEENVVQSQDKDWTIASPIALGTDGGASMKLLWKKNTLCVQVTVADLTKDGGDQVVFYLDQKNAKADNTDGVEMVTVKRSEASATDGGYVVEKEFALTGKSVNDKIGFDVTVADASAGTMRCWNDLQLKQNERSKYYGTLTLKPFMSIAKGSAKIDGMADAAWENVEAHELALNANPSAGTTGTVKAMWAEDALYVLLDVKDAVLNKDNANAWEQDSVEIFVDENNGKTDAYEEDDCQYRINYKNELSFNGTNCNASNIESAVNKTADGYIVEAKIIFNTKKQAEGNLIGVDFQINNANAQGARDATVNWYDVSGMGYAKPSVFGTAKLVRETDAAKTDISQADITGIKNYAYTGKPIKQKLTVKMGGKKLTKGVDYTVSYKKNKNAGKAFVTITGCGKYTGTVSKAFTIKKAAQKPKLNKTGYTAAVGSKRFKLTVKNAYGKLSYKSSNAGIVSVNKNGKVSVKGAGTATITVTAAGDNNHKKASVKATVKVVN